MYYGIIMIKLKTTKKRTDAFGYFSSTRVHNTQYIVSRICLALNIFSIEPQAFRPLIVIKVGIRLQGRWFYQETKECYRFTPFPSLSSFFPTLPSHSF